MGAHTFGTTIGGKGVDAKQAYSLAVTAAHYEHGHDPYNGTISTTEGFVMIDPGKRQIGNVADDVCMGTIKSDVRKWGPAGCIELKGKALKDWRAGNNLKGTRARAFHFFGWAAS